ncbi:MAG: hypothetical protein JWL73_2555 [Actinomycetia bacterium]|nr:hypothetical protein [Actinomycetes bacterium]
MASTGVRFDLPMPDLESQPFWDGLREEKLLLQRCLDCKGSYFYARPFCPKCWSDKVEWFEASGKGILYSYSVVYSNDLPPFGERVPYVAAVVDLEEGPRIQTNVVDCEFDKLSVDMPVTVGFQPISDDITIPVFRPA